MSTTTPREPISHPDEKRWEDEDGMIWRDRQEILYAVGLGGGRVLGYSGSSCYLAITDVGKAGDAFWVETDDFIYEHPSRPGLYIWRGSIGLHFDDDDLDNIEMKGESKPATQEDIDRLMGRHDPLVYDDEEDR